MNQIGSNKYFINKTVVMRLIMQKITMNKKVISICIFLCFFLLLPTSCDPTVKDINGISGEWQIAIDTMGTERIADLSFSENKNGSINGQWGSNELSDVRFEDNQLSFTHIRRTTARDFNEYFTGTLKDGKLTGILKTVTGTYSADIVRKEEKSPVLGQWEIVYNIDNQQTKSKLTIKQGHNGTLLGEWDADNSDYMISKLDFQKDELKFTLNRRIDERESESTFEGTIKTHKLTGILKSPQGNIKLSGERIGADMVGTWELTETSNNGVVSKEIMIIYGDLTGSIEDSLREDKITIENIKLESDKVSFNINVGENDFMMEISFNGTLQNKTLFTGEGIVNIHEDDSIFMMYRSQITGKKIK